VSTFSVTWAWWHIKWVLTNFDYLGELKKNRYILSILYMYARRQKRRRKIVWKVERPILIPALGLKKQTRRWQNSETTPYVWDLGTDMRLLFKLVLVRHIVNAWNGLHWRSIRFNGCKPAGVTTLKLSFTIPYYAVD